jgi:uncharacterized membrane protein
MAWEINKGIGKSVEFKGLKAQYLILFAVGLLLVLFLVFLLFILNIPALVNIAVGITAASLLVYYTFRLNKKYGRYGLMKITAQKNRPRFIINRKPVLRFLKIQNKD